MAALHQQISYRNIFSKSESGDAHLQGGTIEASGKLFISGF